jgi:hypothetical protein
MSSTSNPHAPAAAAASTGFIAGLITIFLPLLQAAPNHLSAGTVQTAVGAGVALCLGSLGGWLVHHGIITKAEMTSGISEVTAHLPQIEQALAGQQQLGALFAKAQADAHAALAKVTEVEAKLPGSAQVVDDLRVPVINIISDLLGDAQLITNKGALSVPKVIVTTPPVAPDAPAAVSP